MVGITPANDVDYPFVGQPHGDFGGAVAQFGDVLTEATAANDVMAVVLALMGRGYALAYQGDTSAARAAADDAVSTTTGWHRMLALTTRARVTRAIGEPEQAERDIREALVCGADIQARTGVADILECLADLASGSPRDGTRLFGAAQAIRQYIGEVRFRIHQPGYDASVAALRQAMGEDDFTRGWEEGAALSTNEAIAYAQRGHGERKRPPSRWASLTGGAAAAL
jgi:hypothetical protein